MIDMKFFQDHDDGSICLTIQGHAGAGKQGEDPVCAAASMAAYTAAQAVQFLYEQDKLLTEPVLKLYPGTAEIRAKPRVKYLAEALMVYWTVQAGAYALHRNYPDRVQLLALALD